MPKKVELPSPEVDLKIHEMVSQTFFDPMKFAMLAFPWGEPDTDLAEFDGPDTWQRDIAKVISEGVKSNESTRIAVASGHGIGKSAFIAWVIQWFMATRSNPQIVVTANTGTQLRTKTWRELSVWHNRSICGHWFTWQTEKFLLNSSPSTHYASAITWSKDKADSFQGSHDKNILMIYDEASGIADEIWDATEGAMTTPGAIWIAFGNPTRNTGRFRECFGEGKFAHRWWNFQVDSRSAKMTNKKQLQEWIDDWGEDSDFARVRIYGQFPKASLDQFYTADSVKEAMERKAGKMEYRSVPVIFGVDVARKGNDASVVAVRQGVKVLAIKKYYNVNLEQFAEKVAELANFYEPAFMCVDTPGVGGGLVDILRLMKFKNVIEVWPGATASDKKRFLNRRIEMHNDLRQWLRIGDLPKMDGLVEEFVSIESTYAKRDDSRQMLESKESMRSRGVNSQDTVDALAYTFWMPVASKRMMKPVSGVDKRIDDLKKERHGWNYGRDPWAC